MKKFNANIDLQNKIFGIKGKNFNIIQHPSKGCNQITIRDSHLENIEKKRII